MGMAGFRICSIQELVEDGMDWKRGLYELTWEIAQDIPNPDEPTRLPFEQYSRMLDNKTLYDYELMFIAFDQETMIGYSRVSPLEEGSKTVQTGMSGVLRPYRRKGIVTALKVRGFESLKERGYEWICTDNDETNPMYDLNQRFGFEKYAEFRAYKLVI
jgi:predicted N-acetyltransferase YhbS